MAAAARRAEHEWLTRLAQVWIWRIHDRVAGETPIELSWDAALPRRAGEPSWQSPAPPPEVIAGMRRHLHEIAARNLQVDKTPPPVVVPPPLRRWAHVPRRPPPGPPSPLRTTLAILAAASMATVPAAVLTAAMLGQPLAGLALIAVVGVAALAIAHLVNAAGP